MEKLNALETMQEELKKNLKEQSKCLDKHGIRVKNEHRDDYGRLVIEARILNEQINWWKKNIYQSA